jgi:hypothetical protein
MSNSYTHFEDGPGACRFIDIVSVKHLGAGRYVLQGVEIREDYENQLKLDGFNLLGFIYSWRDIKKPEVYAFYIPEGRKSRIFVLKYNGRWADAPNGGGRQEQVFTPEGWPEPITARQYEAWQKAGQFHERIPFTAPLPREKVASTQVANSL